MPWIKPDNAGFTGRVNMFFENNLADKVRVAKIQIFAWFQYWYLYLVWTFPSFFTFIGILKFQLFFVDLLSKFLFSFFYISHYFLRVSFWRKLFNPFIL